MIKVRVNKQKHIFADMGAIEPEALVQFESAMEQDFVVAGALMPDVHVGYSLPIGGVVATKDFVVPAWVGYDIGCGMCAVRLDNVDAFNIQARAEEIYSDIREIIPVGFSRHDKAKTRTLEQTNCSLDLKRIYEEKGGLKSLGTLGGGNHFIELGRDETDHAWLIIHSGSRGFGHGVAEHYMKLASPDGKAREGHFGFDVDDRLGQVYLADLDYCLAYALKNRLVMIELIMTKLGYTYNPETLINRTHNHISYKNGMYIHRKGATHAEKGMMGVIPGNMRDGSFIVRGKGNSDALWSSSHGAGRVLGRKAAKQTLSVDAFKETMGQIICNACDKTLDESPFAYKNIFEVMKQQDSLVEVVEHVTPIVNVKG